MRRGWAVGVFTGLIGAILGMGLSGCAGAMKWANSPDPGPPRSGSWCTREPGEDLAAGTARCQAQQQAVAQAHASAVRAETFARTVQPLIDRSKAVIEKADQALALCACSEDAGFTASVNVLKINASRIDGTTVPLFEVQAEQALRRAGEIRAAREKKQAHDAKIAEEQPMVDAAQKLCATGLDACKQACSANDAFACVALGIRIYSTKRTPETATRAGELFRAACDDGRGPLNACESIVELQRRETEAAAKVEQLWDELRQVGDDVATTTYLADLALRISPTSQTQRGVGRMRQRQAATIVEKYCPAKNAFVDGSGVPEFTKRAGEHCTHDAPTHEGVALTTQCRAAYASYCPRAPQAAPALVADDVNSSQLWQSVRQIGDDLAQKRRLIAMMLQVSETARAQRDAQMAHQIDAVEIRQQYCPAKRAFLASFGSGAFQKAAAAHCLSEPPTAQGLSGAQVPLTTECQAVYAMGCP